MLPNDNVKMSVGHLDHVLIVYSSMEHVTWKSPGPACVAELVGSCIPIHAQEAITKVCMVVVPYVKGLSEAFAKILKSHGIATANRPRRMLRNFVVHSKDKVKHEQKTELIYPKKLCCRKEAARCFMSVSS